MSQLKDIQLTEDLRRDILTMMQSPAWGVLKDFMGNKQIIHNETAENSLDASVTSILKREQHIGAAKFGRLDLIDFHNFVTTQTHKD